MENVKTTLRKMLKRIRDDVEDAKCLTTALHDELHGSPPMHDQAFRAERSARRALDALNEVLSAVKGEAGDEQLTLRYAR